MKSINLANLKRSIDPDAYWEQIAKSENLRQTTLDTDELGRLAETNKLQMQQAMGKLSRRSHQPA